MLRRRLSLLSVVALVAPALPAAQRVDLGAPLAPLGLAGDVVAFQLDPAGTRAVFVVDDDGGLVLCSVALDTRGSLARLSPQALTSLDPAFRFSPGPPRVVFRAQRAGEAFPRLFVVPVGGGEPASELGLPLGVAGTLASFELDPSGRYAVFQFGLRNREHLFSVLLDGSAAPVELNAPLATGSQVRDFRVAPQGGRVVYRADHLRTAWYEIFSVPLDRATAPVRVNANLALHGDVHEYVVAPDGLAVAYLAEEDVSEQVELYSRAIDGSGEPLQLGPEPVAGGDAHDIVLTPDGARVVFLGDLAQDEVVELYSAPLDGSAPAARLSGALAPGGGVRDFALTADARRVVYRADPQGTGQVELFGVPVDGGLVPARLNRPLAAGQVASFELGSELRRVLYAADPHAPGRFELFSASSFRASTPGKLAGRSAPDVALAPGLELVQGDGAPACGFARDGRLVLFRARPAAAGPVGLFFAPASGAEKAGLLDGAAGGYVREFRVTPDGTRVVYRGDVERPGEIGLYLQSVAGF